MKTVRKKKTLECSTLHPPAIQTDMHVCELTTVHREKTFWKVSLVCCRSVTSQKGTAADTGSYFMLRNFLFSSNPWGRWASLAGHPCLPRPPSLLLCPISCGSTSSLSFPPTTRWKKVFYSGNSVCRTHCWLSAVLWLFQQLQGASGPTVKGFYHPSGLGTSSGSKKNSKDVNRILHWRPDTHT